LTTFGVILENTRQASTPPGMAEDYAIDRAKKDLASLKLLDFGDYESEVRAELIKKGKQDSETAKDIYWNLKGKRLSGLGGNTTKSSSQTQTKIVHTGVETGGTTGVEIKEDEREEFDKLDDYSKHVFKTYGFKSMAEFKKSQSKNIDMNHEEGWQPKI